MHAVLVGITLVAVEASLPMIVADLVERDLLECAWHINDPDAGGYLSLTFIKHTNFLKNTTRTVEIRCSDT